MLFIMNTIDTVDPRMSEVVLPMCGSPFQTLFLGNYNLYGTPQAIVGL